MIFVQQPEALCVALKPYQVLPFGIGHVTFERLSSRVMLKEVRDGCFAGVAKRRITEVVCQRTRCHYGTEVK